MGEWGSGAWVQPFDSIGSRCRAAKQLSVDVYLPSGVSSTGRQQPVLSACWAAKFCMWWCLLLTGVLLVLVCAVL
jgi:hypothetical protein